MKLRFLGRSAGQNSGDGGERSEGRGRKRVTGLFALAGLVVAVMAVAAACAIGSSTGIRDEPDGASGDDDATSTSTNIPMPVIAGDDASGTSTLPFGDDDDDDGGSNTMIITVGDDDGGEGGTDGGGTKCAANAPSFKCGLDPQCGCEGSLTCDVTARDSGAVSCVGSGGTIQGDKCTSTSDCQQGLTCSLGACRPYCNAQKVGTACDGGGLGSCVQIDSFGSAVPNLKVCLVSCDLTNPSAACGAGGCVLAAGETNCQAVGTAGEFASCTYTTDCAPGLNCITFGSGDSGTSSCRTMCRFGGAACGNNESCTHFGTDLVLNGVTYGFCE